MATSNTHNRSHARSELRSAAGHDLSWRNMTDEQKLRQKLTLALLDLGFDFSDGRGPLLIKIMDRLVKAVQDSEKEHSA